MCRTSVARVTTAATTGATYPQGSQVSEFPFLAKFESMCHSHGLEEAPATNRLSETGLPCCFLKSYKCFELKEGK